MINQFQSPRGCEMQPTKRNGWHVLPSFNPLAGVRCSILGKDGSEGRISFNPLAGMRCNLRPLKEYALHTSFNPLAGMRCNSMSGRMARKFRGVSIPSRV